MEDIPTYDHSKPEPASGSTTSFYHLAAKISLLAPVLSLLFVKSLAYGLKDIKSPVTTLIVVGLGFLMAFIFFVSFVLGVIALTGMSRYGKEGILIRSLAGIVFSVLLLAIWGAGFVHGFQTALQNRKAGNALTQAANDLNEHQKDELARKGSIAAGTGQQDLQKVKSTLDNASKQLSGDEALIAKAGSAYTAKLQALMADYTAAAQAIKSPPVLNMSAVQQREELQLRKEKVTKFMNANEKLLAFVTKAETIFRAELVNVKLPPGEIEAALKGYRSTATDRNYLVSQIRMTDQRIGTAMLGMLDLLDASWGDWKYNPEKKNVTFQDTAIVGRYNEFFKDMNDAAKEQSQLQSELVNLPAVASAQ